MSEIDVQHGRNDRQSLLAGGGSTSSNSVRDVNPPNLHVATIDSYSGWTIVHDLNNSMIDIKNRVKFFATKTRLSILAAVTGSTKMLDKPISFASSNRLISSS